MRVLIVEDQKRVANALGKALELEGFKVSVANRGDEGLALSMQEPFDVMILDIMLPDKDGLEVLKLLREHHKTTPVLLLSGKGDVQDRIRGLNLGADDYVPKPFEMTEVIARVRALGRRGVPLEATKMEISDLSLDLLRREAKRGEKRIELSPRELRLLEYLMRAKGRPCTQTELLENVWDYRPGWDPATNVVQMTMARLREKVDQPFPVKLIHTIFSEGYALREP